MGLHQSRWGTKNLNKVVEIISEYEKHEIPVDGT